MAQLTLRLLGSFEASTPGKPPLKFQTHKIKALLAYLAAKADQAHSREALLGLLWPDYPQSSAMKSLRHALASLRKTIGDPIAQPPYLIISRDTIQINQNSNIYVDVWDFEQKIRQQSAGDITETAIGNITAAINLYHGPFLDDLLCNSEIFDKWVQIRREGQKRQVCTAMKHLALIYIKSDVYKTAIDWARRLLELDSCDESAHRLLMEALTYSGQRSTALAQYETCRLTLQQELDIEPEPETQNSTKQSKTTY